MARRDWMAPRPATHDSRCSLCGQMILGSDGKRHTTAAQELDAFERGEDIPPAHPLDTVDEIVKLDGAWVHAECAAEHGHKVLGR